MNALKLSIGIALMAASPAASALHFFAAPPILHVQGRVDPGDWRPWREAVDRFEGKIDTVVFHNSPGGHTYTGRRIGRSIRQLGLRTVVAGRCMSACASMFLGGKERLFASTMHKQPTVLGFHGTYRDGRLEQRSELSEYFSEMTDGKMPPSTLEQFTSLERSSGALYLIHPDQRTDPSQPMAYLCKGTEDSLNRDRACERLDLDGLAIGVVTSWNAAVTPPAPAFPADRPTSKNW